jgi:hypothetical protein
VSANGDVLMEMMVDEASIKVVPVGDRTDAILADDLRQVHKNELRCVVGEQSSAVQCTPHLLEQVGVQSSDGVATLVLLQKIGDVQLGGVDQEVRRMN